MVSETGASKRGCICSFLKSYKWNAHNNSSGFSGAPFCIYTLAPSYKSHESIVSVSLRHSLDKTDFF